MRRHPVDDDADASLVQPVDQPRETLGLAEAPRRRKEPIGW